MAYRPPTDQAAPRPRRRQRPFWLAGGLVILGVVVLALARRVALLGALTAIMATPTGVARSPAPSPSPTATLSQRIDAYIASLSPTRQIGELLMLPNYTDAYSATLNQPLQQWGVSNLIIFTNYNGGPLMPTTLAGLRQLTADLRAHATSAPLITIDEEGGTVDRLAPYYGPTSSAAALAATGNPQAAYQRAATDASRLLDLGITLDFAPDVDVYQGGAIGQDRTFGATPAQVTTYAGAFLNGLQQHGVLGTLKHWPGIGGAPANPDYGLPTITTPRSQLEAINFAPFHALLSQQPGMIMVTHAIVPAFDPTYPASLSPTLVDGVLRGQLGYQGVVVTDAMEAKGLTQFMQSRGYSDLAQGIAEASVLALLAGDDIVELPHLPDQIAAVVAAVTAAVHSGRISPDRLRQALRRRVIALKVRLGLITLPA